MLTYGFFNAVYTEGIPDRSYTADNLAEFFESIIGDGVSASIQDSFKVLASSGMQVNLSPGFCWIHGYYAKNSSLYPVVVSAAPPTDTRIDAIVLRWSRSDRNILPQVLTGVASPNPQIPQIVRNADTYDLLLGYITLNAGDSAITDSMITDTRSDTEVCGIIDTFSSRLLPDGSVSTAKLQDEAVTTGKIADNSVSVAKFGAGTMKIYNSVTELGLTVGSATIASAFAALPNGSILYAQDAEFPVSELPGSYYGFIEIIKEGSGGCAIYFHGRTSASGEYRMYTNASHVPTGTWIHMTTNDMFVVEMKQSGNFPTSGNDKNTVTINVAKSGYTAIGVVGYTLPGSGSSAVYPFRLYLSSATTVFVALGPANNSYSAKINVYVLYVKN